jgi:hypothetical protein
MRFVNPRFQFVMLRPPLSSLVPSASGFALPFCLHIDALPFQKDPGHVISIIILPALLQFPDTRSQLPIVLKAVVVLTAPVNL